MSIEVSDIRVMPLQGLQTPSTAALDFPASHPELARHQRALLALNRQRYSCVDNSLKGLEKAAR